MRFNKEVDFKETPIGKIPQEWQVLELGDIVSLEYGKGLPQNSRFEGRHPVVGSNGIVGFHNEALVKGPGIVVGRKGTIGAVSWIDDDFWPIDTTYYVKTKRSDVFLRWLFLELSHLNLGKLYLADVVPGLKRDLAYSKILPLPPSSEQEGIVEVISCVNLAIQKVDQAIAQTERLKKRLMEQLLTKGMGHKELKETSIGKTPSTWEVAKLEDVSFDFTCGGTPSTSNPDYWDGDIAWMTSAHINGRIITSGQRYITKEGLENSATHLIPRGNLLVATRVGIGKAAVNAIDIAISQDLTGVVVDKKKALPDFLYWVIINNEKKLKSIAQGSTIKGILRKDLGRLVIPKPSLPEQQKIAKTLSSFDDLSILKREKKERLIKMKNRMMTLLLTGKVRVIA